jgi:Ca2+-binding RTX toxin-like protein
MVGDVFLSSQSSLDADTIVNSGSITGKVQLGGGNDIFNGAGGASGSLFGQQGNDRLIGGRTGDRISGGPGRDTMTGGAGSDHFVFDSALAGNLDKITDFRHGFDKIDLSHALFTTLNPTGKLAAGMFFSGGAAHDGNDHVIYRSANGWLCYDANGKAAGGSIHFATLAAHLTLTNTDFNIIA